VINRAASSLRRGVDLQRTTLGGLPDASS